MSLKSLGLTALGGLFAIGGVMFLTENRVTKATELIKGYKPIGIKLGEPYYFKKVQLNDKFNYVDDKMARAKIPMQGQKTTANVLVYASKENNKWEVDYMEVEYPDIPKYRFYDSKLVKKD